MKISLRATALGLALLGLGSAHADSARVAITRPYKATAPVPGAAALVRTSAGSMHLDSEHYTSVRDGALAMLKAYPPTNHYYVALGRSPVSLYSFLRHLDPDMTTTFPASDLRLGIHPSHEALYFQHFEHYLPPAVLRGERGDIVLFDRSHDRSGSSLALLKPLLEKYIAQKGFKTKVVALGFASQGPLMAGVEHMPTATFPKLFLYYNGADHDEYVATYAGKHTIGTHAVGQLTPNPENAVFDKAMGERMASDPTLDAELAGNPQLKAALAK